MILFILLIFVLITFYWVSMLRIIYSIRLINNTKESNFGIPGASTEPKNYLRFTNDK